MVVEFLPAGDASPLGEAWVQGEGRDRRDQGWVGPLGTAVARAQVAACTGTDAHYP